MNQKIITSIILILIAIPLGSSSSQGSVAAKEIHENIKIISHNKATSPYGFGPIYVKVFAICKPVFRPLLKPAVNVTVISGGQKELTDETGFCQLGPAPLSGIYTVYVYKQGYMDISSGFKHFKFTKNGGGYLEAHFVMIKFK